MKSRLVVIGSKSFIGSSIINISNKKLYDIVSINREHCDLSSIKSQEYLSSNIQDGDVIVFVAARAPCKDFDMFKENMNIVDNFIESVKEKKIKYILNVSSDAIYSDSNTLINEESKVLPDNTHGLMHFNREKLLETNLKCPIGHIRPTLIFGQNDPHNGYGPNLFIRTAVETGIIKIFGNGEEKRDHIYIEDVAKISIMMIDNMITKPINAVSGNFISFLEIAELIKLNYNNKLEIIRTNRTIKMPHNGYRVFSKSKLLDNNNIEIYSLKKYIENYFINKALK